jgi:hypothetical protein
MQSALQQGYISLSQALELFRQARVQNLVSNKNTLLATEPCTVQVVQFCPVELACLACANSEASCDAQVAPYKWSGDSFLFACS